MAASSGETKVPRTPDGPKRPAPTIELQVEAVEDGDEGTRKQDDGESEPDGSPPLSHGPPLGTDASRVAGLFTHLVAGLVGGLIGVISIVVGLDRLSLGAFGGRSPEIDAASNTGAIGVRLGDIQSRIDALTTTTAELEGLRTSAAGQPATLEKSVEASQGRIAALEMELAKQKSAVRSGGERVVQLETALKNIAKSGVQGAQMAGVIAQIDDLANRFDSSIIELQKDLKISGGALEARDAGALKDEIDALKRDSTALTAQNGRLAKDVERLSAGSDAAAQLAPIEKRVAALETRLAELAQADLATASSVNAAVLAMAFASLKRAAGRGGAYSGELDTLKTLAPAASRLARFDFTTLETHALTGVQSITDLKRTFVSYRRAALDASVVVTSDAIVDQLAARARSLVRVRPSGSVQGTGARAVLARMEAHLSQDALAKSIEEAGALEGAARDAADPWIAAAKARLDIDRWLNVLEGQLLIFIGGPEAPGAG